MSTQFLARMRCAAYLPKVAKANDLLPHFQNGMSLGWSGFTGVGYPKAVPIALADHVERNKLQGKLQFDLFVGASTGVETEDRWARLDMIDRRMPHQVGKNIQKGINEDRIRFSDRHLSNFPQDILYGHYHLSAPPTAPIDIAIVEANEILPSGDIIVGASVGATPEIIHAAKKIIIELNTSLPSYKGMHDIILPPLPPNRTPLPITHPTDKIGTTHVPIPRSKVLAVVESAYPESLAANTPSDETSTQIAQHIIHFLEEEVALSRLPPSLLPIQSGIGNIANAVIDGLSAGPFHDLAVWTEVLQDSFLPFFDNGKLLSASATSIKLSPTGFEHYLKKKAFYDEKITLRNQFVSNSPEVIRRLGLIALNTPVEVDIYGHANSTCVNGSRMLNGIGGSGDFFRNAKLSICHTPSTRPTKTDPLGISCIVPFVSHVDHTEHDISVIVTECGVADLRGLSPKERVHKVIDNCAHPAYKDQLREYYDIAFALCQKKGAMHQPHILNKVLYMHHHLETHGTMRFKSWN